MYQAIIIGGGAAGFFAGIAAAEAGDSVLILEQSPQPLGKVKISGGGRCNVTHDCHDPRELVKHYPRGGRELLGPFTKFGVTETIQWFESHGVKLKVESDGRIFPVSNDSQTIIDCLRQQAENLNIVLKTSCGVDEIVKPAGAENWKVRAAGEIYESKNILIATGSSNKMWKMISQMGHTLVEPVPSLFTFHIEDERLKSLMGLSVDNARAEIPGTKLSQQGPLLITHWGLSGPAVLKLSAWGARELHKLNYHFRLKINWTGEPASEIKNWIQGRRKHDAKKLIHNSNYAGIPARLWHYLLEAAKIPAELNWADANAKQMEALAEQLTGSAFEVMGKSTFKEEFVTAGGVKLSEVDFKTMQSKIHPGLFFAGEVLDIDAVTGGFNFQAAWTTGWIAGSRMKKQAEGSF